MRRIEFILEVDPRRELIPSMSRAEYDAAVGLNPSSFKKKSPKHVKAAYEEESKRTDAMDESTGVHTLVWEPHLFENEVVAYDGTRSTRGGKPTGKWAEFLNENDGKLILKRDAYDKVLKIGNAIASDPVVKSLVPGCQFETAVFNVEHGMQTRGLIDALNIDRLFIADLKAVESIEDRPFWYAVERYGWDISMAAYQRWVQDIIGKPFAVKFVAAEKQYPHDVVVRNVPQTLLDNAWRRAEQRISEVRESIETGVWHGIARGQEQELFVPSYAMDEMEIIWEGDA